MGTVKGMSFTQIAGKPISKDTADIIGNGVITANDGNGNSTFGFREISHANVIINEEAIYPMQMQIKRWLLL